MRYVIWRDRKQLAADLWAIYTVPNLEAIGAVLAALTEHWGEQYPAVAPSWERSTQSPRTVLDEAVPGTVHNS